MNTSRERSIEALFSNLIKDMEAPRKTKSVRVEEAKQAKQGTDVLCYPPGGKGVSRALTTAKFQREDLVYNRDTKEEGAVRRRYETHGGTMYEVAVPKLADSWIAGYYVSDWAEDVLQPSTNERLNSSTPAVPAS
jgi:hypothetical protein